MDRLLIFVWVFPYVLLGFVLILARLNGLGLSTLELPAVLICAAVLLYRMARLKLKFDGDRLSVRNLLRNYDVDLSECVDLQLVRVGYLVSGLVPALQLRKNSGRLVVVPLHACFAASRDRRAATARLLKRHLWAEAELGKFVELPVSESFQEPRVLKRRYF